MSGKEIMINILANLVTLTGDVESVDSSEVLNDQYVEAMYCLSLNSYFEARGETFDDKIATAQAVMNRRDDRDGEFRRHNDVCSIVTRASRDSNGNAILNQCWYSWYCDGTPNNPRIRYSDGTMNRDELKAWEDSVLAAFYAYEGLYPDLIGGATHYYNDALANPSWADHYELVGRVGSHLFLR